MRNAVKFLLALIVAVILLFAFRALAFTIYTIPNKALEPMLLQGDRIMVNRWSYGLRVGGDFCFPYERIFKSSVKKGDFIAFNSPLDTLHRMSFRDVFVGKVTALPGDTITAYGEKFVIPKGCQMCSCQRKGPYLISSPKGGNEILVPERNIIGRVFIIVYNLNGFKFRTDRWFQPIQ
jgi:signal peptidase I